MEYLFNAIGRLAEADMLLSTIVSGSQLLTRKQSSDLMNELSDIMKGTNYTWGSSAEGVVEAFGIRRAVRNQMNIYRRILGRALAIFVSSRPTTAQEFTDAIMLTIDQVFGQSAEALRLKADLNLLKIDMPDEDITTSIQARGKKVLISRLMKLDDAMVPLMPGNQVSSQFDVAGYLSNVYNDDVRLDVASTGSEVLTRTIVAKAVPQFTRLGSHTTRIIFDAATAAPVVVLNANKGIMVSGNVTLTREAVVMVDANPRTAARSEIIDTTFLAQLVVAANGVAVTTDRHVKYNADGTPARVSLTFNATLLAGENLTVSSPGAFTAVAFPLSAVVALLTFDSILPLEKGVSPFKTIGPGAELRTFVGIVPAQYLEYMQASKATAVLNEIEAYDDWARRVNDPHINGRTMATLLDQYCVKHYRNQVGPTNNLFTFVGKAVHKVPYWLSQMPAAIFTQAQWADIYCQFVATLPIYAHLAISSGRYSDRWSETEIAEI